jgi:hypothetical protein
MTPDIDQAKGHAGESILAVNADSSNSNEVQDIGRDSEDNRLSGSAPKCLDPLKWLSSH